MSVITAASSEGHGAGEASRLIIAASLGNALEFYEILVYGYFAVIISKVFFPAADEAVSLLVTAFLMPPLDWFAKLASH